MLCTLGVIPPAGREGGRCKSTWLEKHELMGTDGRALVVRFSISVLAVVVVVVVVVAQIASSTPI